MTGSSGFAIPSCSDVGGVTLISCRDFPSRFTLDRECPPPDLNRYVLSNCGF